MFLDAIVNNLPYVKFVPVYEDIPAQKDPPKEFEMRRLEIVRGIIKKFGECILEWRLEELWRGNYKLQGKKVISIYKNDQRLLWKTLDIETNGITNGYINIQKPSIEAEIEWLRQCEVIDMQPNEGPVLAEPCHKWFVDRIPICLLFFNEELIIQVLHRKENTRYRMPLDIGAQLNNIKCSEHTRYAFSINVQKDLSLGYNALRISYLKQFTVKGLKRIKNFKDMPYHCFFQPISQKSRIDKRIRVSCFKWAVTLVAYGSSLNNNLCAIIIEGMDVNKYFMHKVEYNRKEIVSEKISPDDL